MAEIKAQDISVYKNGTWRSLSGGKVYKNVAWRDFQGVAKNGNWYVAKSYGDEIVRVTVKKSDVGIVSMYAASVVLVDWGDGSSEEVRNLNDKRHIYTDSKAEHIVKIFGPTTAITILCFDNNEITAGDVSKNLNIQMLDFGMGSLRSNVPAITVIAKSLPDRTGKVMGYFTIGNAASQAAVQSICSVKNWQVS